MNSLDDKQIRDLIEYGSRLLSEGIQSTDNLRAILAMESVCALFDSIDIELTQRINNPTTI
ncbi:hypothetical protein N4684_02660 [Escherichia coli]|uniref:hypothetical protein n=1 Tax=Escherichia coli TaxID=562 RepID=UPI000D0AFA8A|nr:hypothetical protein [Escherichia coli]MCU6881202.1 hypothetical protein [Escherichia coli]MCU6963402.1 hypothetical protein [Escherichia coli]